MAEESQAIVKAIESLNQTKFLFPHLKNIYNPGNFIKRFYV